MTISQMQERLRLELLRRVERGTVSVSLLARQTGYGQSHLSNFLHNQRNLSLEAMDRVLAAQNITAEDLLLLNRKTRQQADTAMDVPVVSQLTAMREPVIRAPAVQSTLPVRAEVLLSAHAAPPASRRRWQRFVAITVQEEDAYAMYPLIRQKAYVVLDRHCNDVSPGRGEWPRMYAVRAGEHVKLRFVELLQGRLLLRPMNIECPPELLQAGPDESLGDLIVGRVIFLVQEH